MMDTDKKNLGEDDGGTVAIVSYLTLFGLIAALIMNSQNPTSLGRFHIRQSIGILLSAIVLGAFSIIPLLGFIILSVGGIVILIALILGVLSAINKEEKPLPFIGEYFQKWFEKI